MRRLLPLALSAAVAALAWPELSRYAAERRMGYATNAFRALLGRAGDPETALNLAAVGATAVRASEHLPGDPRPWVLAGSSCLLTGRPEKALEFYREAFATGERSEIDLNLGRAYGMLKREEGAHAAYLRAGWINPEILASLPAPLRDSILAEVGRLARDLREGRLAEPPPLPTEERR